MSDIPSMLFVCVRNGGKSQMAPASCARSPATASRPHSAGTHPGTSINALSAEALTEVGADMSGGTPTSIDSELLHRVDLVVTIGRDARVDVPDGVELRNWDTDEPSERGIGGIERMRLIRDDIARRVHALAVELRAPAQAKGLPAE